MDQVSKPVLIALIAVVAVVGVRFTILRPNSGGSGSPASATAPGQAGLQSAIDKANHAVGVSKQSATQHEQAAATASGDATPSPTAPSKAKATATPKAKPHVAPAKPAKPLPKLQPGDKSGPILSDLADGKVVVALFYDAHSADDNAALHAVRQTDRHHGRVVVHSIPIQDVGDYDALTTDVQVLEAPTVMVIGPDRKARTIVGYTEVREIDQTVGDVGGKGFRSKAGIHLTGWAAKADNICQDTGFGVEAAGTPTDLNSFEHSLAKAHRLEVRDRARVSRVPAAGATQKAAKRALIHVYDVDLALIATVQTQIKTHQPLGASFDSAVARERTVFAHARPALHAVHVRNCV